MEVLTTKVGRVVTGIKDDTPKLFSFYYYWGRVANMAANATRNTRDVEYDTY